MQLKREPVIWKTNQKKMFTAKAGKQWAEHTEITQKQELSHSAAGKGKIENRK